jgi:protein-S-isoprenylcysteine O-methyltransferase Ste14
MANWLKRWMLGSGVVAALVFGLAGTVSDPWMWGYLAVWSATTFYALAGIDEELARERFHPPTKGADGIALNFVRAVAVTHLVVGVLDSSRWHLTPAVPLPVRGLALAGLAASMTMFYRAMHENHFFSAVVRVQAERGHRVVDSGPYAVVRHPGYAGLLLGTPLSGLALGSFVAAGIGLVMTALFLRRVLFEDAFLQENLAGYKEYTRRVTSRLIPGVW